MKRIIGTSIICLVTAIGLAALSSCGSAMPYSDCDLDDYIKVGDYEGLTVDGYSISVEKSEIGNRINADLNAATKNKKLKEGAVLREGDIVNMDYTGRIDGKKFDRGSAKGSSLQIGSGSFIEGFEEALIGKKVGQKDFEIEATFPDNYQEKKLQGKDAVFTVSINSAQRPQKPDYNDAFARSQGDFKNTAEYEKYVKRSIYRQKKAEAVRKQQTELWDKVVGDTKVKKYPREEVDAYVEFNSGQIDAVAEKNGVAREDVLKQYGFRNEKDFDATNRDSSRLRVKQELIIMKIAENEDLSFSDEEKEKMVSGFEKQGYDDEKIEEYTGRNMDEYVYIQLLYEKVLDHLLDSARVKK